MTRIALVVSDVDGTLLTKDKILTDAARRAVPQFPAAGIVFTIVSSRPTIGMRFLIEPLAITLPVGAFNGSCIVDPKLNPIEQHLIPAAAAQRSLDVLNQFGVDIWLFTNEQWLTRRPERRCGFCSLPGSCLQDRRLQPRCGAAAGLRGSDAKGVGRRSHGDPLA